ncbi:hypothetical protein DFH07DRAFT_770174 [Mycena maculata]|uniref:Uncharacterized protein n=1 Tax=Mycena maculata TaxID=230809 RepID=A0AAD7JLN8_9AGAR|nr:hypothetical protein DFH07DRAFT_770174 [Mycena maculata]
MLLTDSSDLASAWLFCLLINAIAAKLIPSPALAHALQTEWRFRTRINRSIATWLAKTARLTGFTGSLFPGEHEGRDPVLRNNVPPPLWMEQVLNLQFFIVEFEEPVEAEGLPDAERHHYVANGLAREQDFDDDLVIQLMENLSAGDGV